MQRRGAISNDNELYLLTWNYEHLANAVMRSSIEDICRARGLRAFDHRHTGRVIGGLNTMSEDPIVAEVRRIRDEHAAPYDYDLRKIFASLKDREKRSKRKLASYPPRSPKRVAAGAHKGEGPHDQEV